MVEGPFLDWEIIQVAETKNTIMAWLGISVRTPRRSDPPRPAPRCKANIRAPGTRNPIPTHMNRRIRSLRPQGRGLKEGHTFSPFADVGVCCSRGWTINSSLPPACN